MGAEQEGTPIKMANSSVPGTVLSTLHIHIYLLTSFNPHHNPLREPHFRGEEMVPKEVK